MFQKISVGFCAVKNFVSRSCSKVVTAGSKVVTAVVGGAAAVSTFFTSKSALAASDPQIDAMFAVVDLTSLKTQVATILMATILIPLMFVGASLVKKTIRSARG